MNQTFIRCLDNELKTAALKKHANHKQTPREPEMPFKTLVDTKDQMDLTRTITNNHKRLYEVNQTTNNISEDLKQMNVACNNINDLNQNDLEQFEGTICNVLNGINNTYDRKNFKGRPKFALFCSYCSSHGQTKRRCFNGPRRESIARPKERSFYSHMRNNQNLPNRRIDSNNIIGRQLPSTSPVYHNSRSRTPYRSQSRNNSNNNLYSRDNRYYQGHRNSNNNSNNRSGSYKRNNYNRSRINSYNRNNNHNKYNNSRSSSRYTNQSHSRQLSSYNRNNNNNNNNNNNYNNNNRQRHYSKDSNKSDGYRQRSGSNNRHYLNNNNNKDHRKNSTQRDQDDRYHSKDRRTDRNKYNNNNKNRINNIETEKQNDDPPGIDKSESSNEDQELLDNFYNANEDTCNTVINTLESNPTWILPMYQCNKNEQDFTKQKPILEIDFLLDSGARLSLLNEDTWNEIKYNNPNICLEQSNKTLTAANNTTIETFGTVTLNLTPDKTSNNRNKT